LDNAVDRGEITYNCGDRYAFYNTDYKLLEKILPESNLKEWNLYKSYLCDYMFNNYRESSFHFHSLSLGEWSTSPAVHEPLIARIEYPENVQLKLWNNQNLEIVKNAGLLNPKFAKKLKVEETSPEWIMRLIE
jgi:hypothetical protein